MSDYSDLDPSIAEMLSNVKDTTDESEDIDLSEFESAGEKKFSMEDFARRSKLFDSKADSVKKKTKSIHEVDLSQHEFEPVEQMLSDEASSVFEDKSYYKTALTNENASSQRVHQLLSKYLTCQDPKDRTVYRQNLISAYWELLRGMAPKMADINLPMPKRMMCRFGVLLPSLFRPEQKTFFSRIFFENRPCEPVMYVDEWFKEIAAGRMSNSMTDEKRTPVKAANAEEAARIEQTRLMQLKSKNSGKLQSAENLLNIKENERAMLETELKAKVDQLCEHNPVLGFEPHLCEYDEMQLKLFSEISDRLHRLSKNNKELSRCLREFQDAKGVYTSVENKLAGGPDISAATDSNAVNIEFQTVRQMAKMTVGRQGNQFPIFTREFFHCTERGTGTRENVIEILRWVESVDPGAFCRIHKNVPNRIVPYVLLIPTYGDRGFCWEPFDRYNRVTSRGRIVIPMYPRDLKIAVLTAVADLRWQVAKEKASYYWMEEGLTGQYYQHIDRLKLKGDLKAFFIEDYVLWMTKESEGVQRLDKEVRGIFWRNMPFPNERKQELRKRSLVYDELCIKDNNRAMSDGY
ncbi:hypothetical protein [Treponema sp.]|uniref:hypothetical protein n=1 Tax=Treponema sp. TaxID=166 RepID=UPI00257A6B53|nr:hypothetical protein [Treponema sp.]